MTNLVVTMGDNVNKKIIVKIEKSALDDQAKKFLIKILNVEFQHIEDKKWRFGEEYERLIRYHTEKFEVKK